MQSLQRGFKFLEQSWRMALADRDLIKPSIYALLAGFLVTVLGSIPIVTAYILLGETGAGRFLAYSLGALLVFLQYTISYLFSGMTIYLIFGYLSEGDGRMDRAWSIVRRDLLDILSLAAASTAVNLLKSIIRGKGNRGGRNLMANLLDTLWTQAAYLVLPAMIVEDIGLRDALRRATQIMKENLLLIGVSTVGVRAVNAIIGFLLSATGIGMGTGVGLGLISITNASPLGLFSGISLGVLIAGFFVLVAMVITSYTATAYHTCLYIWARDVEQAQIKGQVYQTVRVPRPLQAALD